MHLLAVLTWLAIAWSAYARPAVRPVLPPVADADTETVTNMPFTAWERGLREFRFDLAVARPVWLHSLDWNMVRLTGRGENVRVGERFLAKITPFGFVFHLR